MGESVHRSLPTLRVFFVANFLQHGQRSYQIKGALPFNFNLVHSNVHNTLLFLFSHSCGFFFGFLLVFLFYDIAEYWRLGLARFLPLRRAFPKQIIKCSGDLFKFQFYVTCFSKEVGYLSEGINCILTATKTKQNLVRAGVLISINLDL